MPFGNWDGFGISTKNLAAQYTRIITPAIANVFRVGLNYWTDYRMPQNHEFDPSKLIPGVPPPLEGLGGLPTISMTVSQRCQTSRARVMSTTFDSLSTR